MDEYQEKINTFYKRFCNECFFLDTCEKIELLNHIKCGFEPAFKKVWKIVDSSNGICTKCGLFILNDSGICPECKGGTRKQWVQTRVRINSYERIKNKGRGI